MQYGNKAVHASGGARRSQRAFSAVLFALATGLTAAPSAADELSLLVNGKALHLGVPDDKHLNEKNWGLGLQYDWDLKDSKWIPFATASGFIDSNKNPSYYAGGGALRRFEYGGVHADLGAIAFLMTRENFKHDRPFPGVLPVLSIGAGRVALNMTYIPKVEPKAVPLWFFQLKIGMSSF